MRTHTALFSAVPETHVLSDHGIIEKGYRYPVVAPSTIPHNADEKTHETLRVWIRDNVTRSPRKWLTSHELKETAAQCLGGYYSAGDVIAAMMAEGYGFALNKGRVAVEFPCMFRRERQPVGKALKSDSEAHQSD
jgi:hypothetical protein